MSRVTLLGLPLALLVLCAGRATRAAPAPPPLLAVLELESPDQAVSADELLLLTDTLRSAVVEEVGIEPTLSETADLQSAALPLAHLLRGVLV